MEGGSLLSEGRSRPWLSRLVVLMLVGVVYLAMLGAFVTVRALVGWLT